MQVSINKNEIVEAVTNIQRGISTKTSIPALQGILIKTGDNILELSTYDLELGMVTTIPAVCKEGGAIILESKFTEIVKRAPADTINITVDDKNNATIVSGKSEFMVAGIPAEEFPELPKVADAISIKVPSNVLKSMISQTLFAIADSDAKPIHQGSMFNIEDGKLDIVSVDGYRLAKRTEPIKFEENIDFVVPGKALREIGKLLKDNDDEIEMAASRRHIIFTIDNYTVISNLIEGEFLNYKATIPADTATEVVVNTRAAIDSVERASLLITDRLKSPLRCTFSNNTISLLCTTANGRAQDEIPAEINGPDIEIGFNNRYLLDALKNTESDEIKIQLNTALSPMKIVPREGDSFLFLVLPVRLKTE